jgi:hypothetical protein
VLLEWDQSTAWCDLKEQRDHEALRRLLRDVSRRAVPVGAALFALGFWLIGRIPGGGGPVPGRLLLLAAPLLLVWPLLYAALRFGLVKPQSGTRVRVRLRRRGIQFVHRRRVSGVIWSSFDAFDFVVWNEFELVRLRLRSNWLLRRLGPPRMVATEFGGAGVEASSIRETLRDRGLGEEPLGEPGPGWRVAPARSSPGDCR